MEEGRQVKKTIASWTLVGVVFVAIIIILAVKFMKQGDESARNQSRDKLINYASTWASIVKSEITSVTSAGNVFSEEIIRNEYSFGDENTLAYARALIGRAGISHVLFCNGETVICDENGKKESVPDLSTLSVNRTNPVGIVTVNEDRMLTVYIPCLNDNSYILVMKSLDAIGNEFPISSYEDVSFISLLDRNGDVIGTFSKGKDTDSAFLSQGSVMASISMGSASSDDVNYTKAKIKNGMSGSIEAEYQNDVRTIAFAPVGVSNWILSFGVRQSYVEKLVKFSFKNVKSTVINLIVVTSIFAIFVVSTMVFSSLRTKERGRVLEDKADTDLLTELNNKAATERKIQEYLSDNPNGRAMMFILDIDNFKKINDTMGHAFGDTLLKTLGKEIRTEFRMTDIIGRTGGDEFMVFLKDVTDDLIVEREANRITRFFHDFKAGGDYVKYSATASIGAAIFPDDAKSFKDLYVAADQALYRAKKRGKNQLCFYNEAAHK